jgi:hypothetical protein
MRQKPAKPVKPRRNLGVPFGVALGVSAFLLFRETPVFLAMVTH